MDSGKRSDQGILTAAQMMDRRKFLVAGSSALTLTGLLAACGGGGSTTGAAATTAGGSSSLSNITYGFSHPYAEVPIVQAIKNIVKEKAEAINWTVLLDESKAGSVQEQTGVIETWITQQINALCLFPVEPSTYEAMARRAVEGGMIWTTYSEQMKEGAGGVLFPNNLSGEVTGNAAVKWINENDPEAEVGVLELGEGNATAKERTTVPEKLIEEQTKAKIVGVGSAAEQAKGLQVTEDLLQAHPGITVMVCHNDSGALGAAEAFRKSSSAKPADVFIIGQDGEEQALIELKNPQSYYKASAALDISKLCDECVNVPKRALEKNWKKGDPQEYVELKPTLIEQGETKLIEEFLKPYSQA
jgi:ribose transport system substrate-binding protein